MRTIYYKNHKIIVEPYENKGYTWSVTQADGEPLDTSEYAFQSEKRAIKNAKDFLKFWMDHKKKKSAAAALANAGKAAIDALLKKINV